MPVPYAVLDARPGWTSDLQLPPGAHVAVLGATSASCVEARHAGLEFRDTLLLGTANGWQVAVLFRVPCVEGTVAAQVLKTGTGALWIEGSRVSTDENLNGGVYAANPKDRWDGAENWRYKRGQAGEFKQPSGRWPSNLLFVHKTGCVQDGVKTVQGDLHSPVQRTPNKIYGNGQGFSCKPLPEKNPTKADRIETVAAWSCVEGCPVAALDVQSGVLHTHATGKGHVRKAIGGFTTGFYGPCALEYGNDQGGASRFYPQFLDETGAREWLTRLLGGP